MEKIKVRDAVQKFIKLLDEGKGDWDLIIENEEGTEVYDSQVVAIKPQGMKCLFG